MLTYDSTIKDRLMSYDGNSITYDSKNSFNVSSYKGNYYTFEGRRLTKITNSSGYWEYTYNDLGLRTKKCNQDGTITYYEYDGDKLIYEKSSTARLDFLYDENGELYGFIKDSKDKYFYIRDCLKNILGIIDSEGKLVVKYYHEAYGKCTIISDTSGCSIGSLNPFRYKGYYYDSETGMYYCQSRYYVPDWCRWLNADNPNFLEPQSLNGLNIFAYCGNDPVNAYDLSGAFDSVRLAKALGIIVVAAAIITISVLTAGTASPVCGAIVGATLGVAGEMFSQAVVENKSFKDINYGQVAVSGVAGLVSSLPGVNLGVSIGISFVAGSLNSYLGGEQDLGNILLAGAKSACITAVAGLATRCIGLGKISKLDKGNYANKKLFLKSQKVDSLKAFNPSINKQQGLISFIREQVGLSGLMKVANNAAGFAVNTLGDITSSAVEMLISLF